MCFNHVRTNPSPPHTCRSTQQVFKARSKSSHRLSLQFFRGSSVAIILCTHFAYNLHPHALRYYQVDLETFTDAGVLTLPDGGARAAVIYNGVLYIATSSTLSVSTHEIHDVDRCLRGRHQNHIHIYCFNPTGIVQVNLATFTVIGTPLVSRRSPL